MKICNSLKSLKSRHRDCRVIRRRGRTYVSTRPTVGSRLARAELRGALAARANQG